MYLKRLEIQGFKSFAKKTVLEFEPGVTSIVGPNGSGKSNVADSLRWVLGEQSAKLLRGKRSDDVIFAGSDKRTKLSLAEVVATFDNSDGRIAVESSEVSIGRRVDRSGESEYLINGNKVRLLDIIDLVLKSNIGTSRYTVVGQGTIDQLILAGPAEIKSLIDEASGVKAYYTRREKTLRRLETTAQNLMRAQDLINEIEPRLKSLRRQAKRMEAREALQTELRVYQREWYGVNYWNLKKEISSRMNTLSILQAERFQLEADISAHIQLIENKERETQQSNAQFAEVKTRMSRLQEQKNKLLEQLSLIRGKMDSYKTGHNSDPATLTLEIHALQRTMDEIKQKLTSFIDEETQLSASMKDLESAISRIDLSLSSLYDRLSHPETVDWHSMSSELEAFEKGLDAFVDSFEDTSTVHELRAQAERMKQKFISFAHMVRQAMNGSSNASEVLQKELGELLKQKDQLSSELQALHGGHSRLVVQKEFLEKQYSQLEQQLLNMTLELKKSESGSSDVFLQSLMSEENRIAEQSAVLSQEMEGLELLLQNVYKEELAWKQQFQDAEKIFREKQGRLNVLRDTESGIQVEKAKFDAHMESLSAEVMEALGDREYSEIIAREVPLATPDLEDKISRLKHQLELVGGVDELTMQEFHETEERHSGLTSQVSDLERGMRDLRQIIEELDEHIRKQFGESFAKINEKFEFYFRMLFNGGRGNLSLIRAQQELTEGVVGESEEDRVLETGLRPEEKLVRKYEQGPDAVVGIDIKATPPGKKLSSIQALSGGERALTSIALLCSMLACFPSPFVVLDEVDAALDEANTIRFGQILGTLAHQTQFVTITHNRETMAQSSMLYGVTMGDDGVSKLLSIKFDQATVYAK